MKWRSYLSHIVPESHLAEGGRHQGRGNSPKNLKKTKQKDPGMRKGYFLRCHLTTLLSDQPKAFVAQKKLRIQLSTVLAVHPRNQEGSNNQLVYQTRKNCRWTSLLPAFFYIRATKDLVHSNLRDLRIWFWIVWTEFSLFGYCTVSVKGPFSTWMFVFRYLCLPQWRTLHLLPSPIQLERGSLDAFWNWDSTHPGKICRNFHWPSAFQSQKA